MRNIIVAAASLNQIPLAWEHNKENIVSAIKKARLAGATILCCPELCITGYGCEDTFLSKPTLQMALKVLNELLPETKGMSVAVGLPVLHKDMLYNVACLLNDGKIAGFVAKQNLAKEGVYYEPRWFQPWPEGLISEVAINNRLYPIGDIIFEISGLRLGFEICEDAWVVNRTGIKLSERGVDLILNPSASHFAFKKLQIRKRLIQEGSRIFKVGYIYANLLGNEAGRIIYDGDTLILQGGQFIAEGARFSFQDQVVTTAVMDIDTLRQQQATSAGNVTIQLKPDFPENKNLKEIEFTKACTLGLFDYLRKSHAKGFVLNLSGGADSAACACLVYLMVHLSIQELGKDEFQKKLSYIFCEKKDILETEPSYYLQKLLICLYQRTKNNSEITETSATLLANALGVPFAELSVDVLVESYCKLIETVMGRALTWTEDDIALQNIQSRVRAPSAWLLANVRQAIVLCTSNRSEASTGYGTMDGDMFGSLCPLGGVDKSFILQWLKWLELEGLSGIGPIKALNTITEQKPTAELRPLNRLQTDEADLMPYAWLDTIERLFVFDKKSALEILEFMQKQYPEEMPKTLANAIERFLRLWSQNQWKRERLAPSFHLDDESVDPKTWCRFPILSGGFEWELKEMWLYVTAHPSMSDQ